MGCIEKFDALASEYDTPERTKLSKLIAGEIRHHIEDGHNKMAMDYGCGTGLIGLGLLPDFGSLLLVDASKNMLRQVEQKLEKLNVKNAAVLCADLEQDNLPLPSADYIMVVQVLHHIKNIELFLSSLYRALNKGGHLIVVDFNKIEALGSHDMHHGFVQAELIGTVLNLSFVKAEAQTFHSGENLFMGKEASLFILDTNK